MRRRRYGDWHEVVWALADADHERAERVWRWPAREALEAYRRRARVEALKAWRHDMLLWTLRTLWGGQERPPEVPPALKGLEGVRDGG